MTNCEYLQTKKDECVLKGIETEDCDLKKFFFNAADGFQKKLEALTLEEAQMEIES